MVEIACPSAEEIRASQQLAFSPSTSLALFSISLLNPSRKGLQSLKKIKRSRTLILNVN